MIFTGPLRQVLRRGLGLIGAVVLAGTLTVAAPAHAAGTGSIGGTITDDGAPVVGASIEVSSEDGNFWDYTWTDQAGQYEVLNVPEAASAYRVRIDASGHPTQYAHGKVEWSAADRYTVTAGQRTTVDDVLLPTGTITGRFTDSAGNGVSAWVYAYDDSGSLTATADTSDGRFSFRVLPGTYRVRFDYGDAYQYAYGTRDYWAAARFAVTVDGTVTVDDVKLEGGSIAGRVTNADGTPAAGVEVEAQGDERSTSTTTDGTGAYRIDDLMPGGYRVAYRLPSGATQWAHQVLTPDSAQTFTVAPNAVTTVDEQLLATGAIAGRFTDSAGAPMPGVEVSASQGDEFPAATATTDADGRYRLDDIFGGTYRVHFRDWPTDLDQYAHGKLTAETADPITVTAGQTTTVDDSRLPTSSIRVTARDSVTGAAIDRFFVYSGELSGNTGNGVVVLSDVPVGTHVLSAGADGYVYRQEAATVTVVAGQQASVELSLRPVARITTIVTDKATEAPLAGVCVFAVKPTEFRFPDGCPARSDATGAVAVEVQDPGTVNLFALPDRGSPYGAQWVGLGNGTGDQSEALPITVASGQTVPVNRIKMDPAGIIVGKVTSETGAALQYGTVGIVGPDLGVGADQRLTRIDDDGVYRVDWLGPYRWPLTFWARGHAFQWSGGGGNRLDAELVSVKKNRPTTFNHTLKVGTDVTVKGPAGTGYCRVVLFNAASGDPVGVRDTSDLPTGATMPVIGPQNVKVRAGCADENFWHGGADFATATTVGIPASGATEITMVRN